MAHLNPPPCHNRASATRRGTPILNSVVATGWCARCLCSARHKIRRLGSVRHWHSLARNRRIRRAVSLSRPRPIGAFSSVLFLTPGLHTHLEPCASGVVNLQIAIPSQFPPREVPLGNALEPGPLQAVRLDAQLGGWPLRQWALEHLPQHPDHAAVLADLDPNSTACRSACQRTSSGNAGWETVPLALSWSQVRSDEKEAPRERPGQMTNRKGAQRFRRWVIEWGAASWCSCWAARWPRQAPPTRSRRPCRRLASSTPPRRTNKRWRWSAEQVR